MVSMQPKAFIEFAGWVYHACGHNTSLADHQLQQYEFSICSTQIITDCQMSMTPVSRSPMAIAT